VFLAVPAFAVNPAIRVSFRVAARRWRRLAGAQDNAGLPVLAFEHYEHGAAGTPGIVKRMSQPLRHRDREAPRHHWCHLKAVDGDQLAVERAEIDMKTSPCGTASGLGI
jgi:hypothetical protein